MILNIGQRNDDALFLQVKEAQASVLERYTEQSTIKEQGERVVAGQRLMQAASDRFLGWLRIDRPRASVRLLRPPAPRLESFLRVESNQGAAPGDLCAHCGSPSPAPMPAPAGVGHRVYLGKSDEFDGAIDDFSEAYAAVNRTGPRGLCRGHQGRDGR